jgi:Fur family ferric uptake transcriptional regulator
MTEQRRVILAELAKLKTHPTASELYEIVRVQLPHISLGTVYRNLEEMSKSGVILKLSHSDASNRFDADTSNHSHITCASCGRVDDIDAFVCESLPELPEMIRGYKVLGRHVELIGLCPDCQQNQCGKEQ